MGIYQREPDAAFFLWPVSWLEFGSLRQYMVAIPILLFLLNCVIVFNYESRLLRILFAVLCLFDAAIVNSFGAINHGLHEWFWISFILIFLPNGKTVTGRAYKLATLSTIVYVQATLLLFYSMAGSAKLLAGLEALGAGNGGNFAPLGFSSLLAKRMINGDGSTILGWFFIDYPYFGMPAFTIVILIQSVSLIITILPRMHRLWGLCLIGFHLGTVLLLSISFTTHVLWLAIFMVTSPFILERSRFHTTGQSAAL